MAKSVVVTSWRTSTPKEVLDFFDPDESKPKKGRGAFLVVRTRLKPVDVYAYLRARFGVPNGPQNLLRKDDSDNWIHWDFSLKADDIDVYLAGTSREIHFMINEKMTDEDWKNLILNLKSDFARIAKAKSEMLRTFEKFFVFQNKFVTIAGLCADMHASIADILKDFATIQSHEKLPKVTSKGSTKRYTKEVEKISKRASELYGDCLKLRLMTPVMAEAFINMVILVFCKDEVRNDSDRYTAFIRSNIPQRIASLSENCFGFTKEIAQTTKIYGDFKRVMDKRNFAIHGNVDPVKEQIETVYFEGRRPLFSEGGANALKFFEQLEIINAPAQVIADYEAVHLFLLEITEHLTKSCREFFKHVIDDPYPGYQVHKKRVTKILPNHNVDALMPRLRYDDDLNVD